MQKKVDIKGEKCRIFWLHVQEKRHGKKNTYYHTCTYPTFLLFFAEKLLMPNAKEYNRTTSRFEAHLVFKHTQKPDFLSSNAR